ncbi:MAG TPA: hypothetical protein VJ732_08355 [Bryobacteraceae bacterium]|nr:hypothetical protein [Bryobacteraceae bacterium]
MANAISSRLQRTGPQGRRYPSAPQNIEDLGLPSNLIFDIVLRYIREHGTVTLSALRRAIKISIPVADAVFQRLRQQRMVEVQGMTGQDYVFSLVSSARQQASESLSLTRYAGPAPVPLAQYTQLVRAQRTMLRPTREDLRTAMGELVLNDQILDQLGPAVTSGRPIFLYGPSGNGKTSVIVRLPLLFGDEIFVPYCVEVDGHIISVFDPAVHIPSEDPDHEEGLDTRWVRCRRPCVIAGGELVMESLSVRMDQGAGVYAAPLQMKAANGILLIDDFGRQAMEPRDLFNRWMMPLDTRADYLSLLHGFTFQIPFEVTLVFSTNLRPVDLVDEAFIRRVPNKIYLGPIEPERFDQIFEGVLVRHKLPYDPEMGECLRRLCKKHGAPDLRGCYPGDICEIMAAMASYDRKPFVVSEENLARATELYFMHQFTANA